MLIPVGETANFYAHYTEDKVSATGLTVTIDVYKNGTEVVTAGEATNVGDGLYAYAHVTDAAGVYIGVFKTTTTTVDRQDIPSMYIAVGWLVSASGVAVATNSDKTDYTLSSAGVTTVQSGLATSANQTTILNRIGAFTGSGINNILGVFQALLRSDTTAPSDVGGTFDPADDSVQAIADAGGGGDSAWSSDEVDFVISKVTQIGDGSGFVNNPVISTTRVRTVRGMAYKASIGTQLDFTYSGYSTFVGGSTTIRIVTAKGERLVKTLTGSILDADTVRYELEEADSAGIATGDHVFELSVTLSGGDVIKPTSMDHGRWVSEKDAPTS